MDVDATLERGAQFAKGPPTTHGAFKHLLVTSEPFIALDTPAGDTALNGAALEVCSAEFELVGLLRVQLAPVRGD